MVSLRVPALIALAVLAAFPVAAEEGMWPLAQLDDLKDAVRSAGLTLAPKEIWDPSTNSGLAGAVVSLGGCTASFVSPDGLIATNHHCAFSAVQLNSTPENNILEDGFVAANQQAELRARGTRVLVFKGWDDVTREVLAAVRADMAPADRAAAVEGRRRELVAQCDSGSVRCQVVSMFGGAGFYRFRQLELTDVRLVYVPPRGIGEFGGEVDNWMWPRHTGDFALLRAWVGPDGAPAPWATANVPYRPERYLKLAQSAPVEGEFAMILGYPGATTRYRTAAGVAEDLQSTMPRRVKLLQDLVAILEAQGRRGKDVELRLATQLKQLDNSLKKALGMLEGAGHIDLLGSKQAEERRLESWIAADPARKALWGDVVSATDAALARRAVSRERDFLLAWLPQPRATSLLGAAVAIERWTDEKSKPELDRPFEFWNREERALRQRLASMQRGLDLSTDREVLRYLLRRAVQLPAGQRVTAVDQALTATGKTGEDAITAFLDRLYAAPRLADPNVRETSFALDHAALLAQQDPWIAFAAALRRDQEAKERVDLTWDGSMLSLVPRLAAAVKAWRGTPIAPDANGTLRFTYGQLHGVSPRDGVVYTAFTRLRGVVEKHTGEAPFNVPERELEAARTSASSPYRDSRLGDVPVCFLSSNDITGGNSGSPIMNSSGELIGLAFDSTWEGITADYRYDAAIGRTINVDVRYLQWVLDSVEHAGHLLRELRQVRGNR
jgi:hypothetical protein